MEKGKCVTNNAGIRGYPYALPKNLNLYLVKYIKMNSKWIIDLNVKTKFRKLLGENVKLL